MSFSSRGPESGNYSSAESAQQQAARREAARQEAARQAVEAKKAAAAEAAARRAAQSAPKSTKKSKKSGKRGTPRAHPPPRGSRPSQAQVTLAGPPSLNRLIGDNQRRVAALDANQHVAAASALRDVVVDLDSMLVTAAAYISKVGTRRSRQSFQEAIPQLVTVDELTELPFHEVADILGLPAPVMDDLFDRLARTGGFIRTDRDLMLREIRALRQQLQTVAVTRNHSLLDRLIGFIVRIGQAIGIATASAPVGALAVGEPVIAEAIMAGVTALVALALHQTATYLSKRRHDHQLDAADAHTDLLTEITNATRLATPPAYEGEAAVLRFRLEVRCARARVASLPQYWPEKVQYWKELDDLLIALHRNQFDAFDPIRRRLETNPPPSH